jgi:hypothetical protein
MQDEVHPRFPPKRRTRDGGRVSNVEIAIWRRRGRQEGASRGLRREGLSNRQLRFASKDRGELRRSRRRACAFRGGREAVHFQRRSRQGAAGAPRLVQARLQERARSSRRPWLTTAPSLELPGALAAAMQCPGAKQPANWKPAIYRRGSRQREPRYFPEHLSPTLSAGHRAQEWRYSQFAWHDASQLYYEEGLTSQARPARQQFLFPAECPELWRILLQRLACTTLPICRQFARRGYSKLSFRVDGAELKCHHSENSFV